MDSPSSCICFICDENFLLPTLVAATQARQNVSSELADVIVFFLAKTDVAEDYSVYFRAENIVFKSINRDRIKSMAAYSARLFLDEFLDERYDDIVYMDADIQVRGSLDPLLRFPLQHGMFLAARDPMTICRDWTGSVDTERRQYFAQIGIAGTMLERYFNAGIMRASRGTWRDITSLALKRMEESKVKLRFAEQDALNLVAQHRCLTISFKWNFPTFFNNVLPSGNIGIRVEHFMSNPRPWQGPFAPWYGAGRKPYLELAARYPKLNSITKIHPLRFTKYALQQEYKKTLQKIEWRHRHALVRIDKIEAEASI